MSSGGGADCNDSGKSLTRVVMVWRGWPKRPVEKRVALLDPLQSFGVYLRPAS